MCHCLTETMIPLCLNLNQVEKIETSNMSIEERGCLYVPYKNHVDTKSKKCRHNSVNCALHCSRHTLIENNSLQVQGFQALVILYMLLGNEELQPPQEKEEEHNKESDSRLILFDRKLFKLVNNVGDALCLFFSVSSFLTELHSQEKYTFPGE